MAQIQFYHLTATPIERALPKLMEKAIAGGFRALLVAGDKADALDEALWTYDAGSFLPHGQTNGGHAQEQPVLIVREVESSPANGAKLIAITDGSTVNEAENFERILDIFDGQNAESVAAARVRWKHYTSAGHQVTYLRQNGRGGWEQPTAA